MTLKSILYGWITFTVTTDRWKCDLFMDDASDCLIDLVRFVRLLDTNEEANGSFADRGTSTFTVRRARAAGICWFRVEVHPNDGGRLISEVAVDSEQLAKQFRDLACAIADHPSLGHHYVCYGCFPDADFDSVSLAAEREWEKRVESEGIADDFDTMEEFVGERITSQLLLPPDCEALAGKYRTMLRTSTIPPEWCDRPSPRVQLRGS